MTPRRQHMSAALQRSGTSARTQPSSVREGRLLAQCYGQSPPRIADAELQHDMLHRTNVEHLAPTSRRLCSRGIRFCSLHVLARDGQRLDLMRAQAAYRLPALLRGQAMRRLLRLATPWHHRVSFPTVSSVGRRRHAGRLLPVADRDGPRRMGHGHRGTGAKDRDGPRPPDPFAL
jgi:integrase/recombinase XerD